ncbi:MAG TPA: CBS domain-containing protein [Candidatus Aquilonibacter sp.]|nr:CBS domain-containing protein [Candidatus Aquilonibacter sp.]
MLRSSIPFGRFFGVEVRVHLSFLLLLAIAVGYSAIVMNSVGRGFGLWLALCFAVIVREVARSLAALYSGFRLRALVLLPVGGVMAFAPREPGAPQPRTRLITAAGPLANTYMGLLLMGFCYGLEPRVSLLAQPWISFHHLLRSTIWIQFVIAAFNLLPIAAAPSRQFLRQRAPEPAPVVRSSNPAFGLSAALAVAIVIAGFVLSNVWFIFFGGLVLLWTQLRMGTSLDTLESSAILVSDVMLTEYTLLSSSDTLSGALAQTSHSLQDVFPVVRGDRLVGAISRQTLVSRLASEGDGYLQAAMTRNLPLAEPTEKLVDALRRASSLGASEFVPVVENGSLLGILTPHSLSRAVNQVRLTRPPPPSRNE